MSSLNILDVTLIKLKFSWETGSLNFHENKSFNLCFSASGFVLVRNASLKVYKFLYFHPLTITPLTRGVFHLLQKYKCLYFFPLFKCLAPQSIWNLWICYEKGRSNLIFLNKCLILSMPLFKNPFCSHWIEDL